jgi:cadmium resistance protein CadD (predicted permease)
MLFFSTTSYHKWQIVVGQYIGIGALVAVSTLGSLLALVVPPYVIALQGLVPIIIGVVRLSHLRNNNYKSDEIKMPVSKWHNHFSILMVAGVTFSDGGDSIGIYIPLFAKYNSSFEVMYIFTIFMIMTAVWCIYCILTSASSSYCKKNEEDRAHNISVSPYQAWHLHFI